MLLLGYARIAISQNESFVERSRSNLKLQKNYVMFTHGFLKILQVPLYYELEHVITLSFAKNQYSFHSCSDVIIVKEAISILVVCKIFIKYLFSYCFLHDYIHSNEYLP